MIVYLEKRHTSLAYKTLCGFIAITFLAGVILPPTPVCAQAVFNLPVPGTMVPVSAGFVPARLIGITIHPDNPLKFDFIVNTGDANLTGQALKEESRKLIKYFLASLTVPEDELWVNLSPYEKNRMIPQGLGQTEMGRDMLAQDYLLKQLTASLMYPGKELGKEFWEKIYKEAREKYGTTEIPVNTFNKVWVVPQEAVVYEKDTSAFVVKSRLKVMLEEDYLASGQGSMISGQKENLNTDHSPLTTEIIREIILPAIEKEVNEGENFANLRQMYNSLILAAWYKLKLKDGLLGKIYVDQNKTKGIDTQDKTVNQKIYEQYIESFKKGVYNYIKEDYDPATQDVIPRKYFSGGLGFKIRHLVMATLMVWTLAQSAQGEELVKKASEKGQTLEVVTVLSENFKGPDITALESPLATVSSQSSGSETASSPMEENIRQGLGDGGQKETPPVHAVSLQEGLGKIIDFIHEVRKDGKDKITLIALAGGMASGKSFVASILEGEIQKQLPRERIFIFPGDRFSLPERRRDSQRDYPYNIFEIERLKYALDNLRHGQLALVPLFDRRDARRIEISEAKRRQILHDQKENIIEIGGYRFVELEESKKENEHLLIKKDSRLFLDLDTNELVEGILPQAGEIYLFDLSISLFGQSIRRLYDYKIYIWASTETRRERYLQRWRMGEKHPQLSLSQIMEKVDNIFGVRDKVVLLTSDTADLIINNNSSSFPPFGQGVAEEGDYPAPASASGNEGASSPIKDIYGLLEDWQVRQAVRKRRDGKFYLRYFYDEEKSVLIKVRAKLEDQRDHSAFPDVREAARRLLDGEGVAEELINEVDEARLPKVHREKAEFIAEINGRIKDSLSLEELKRQLSAGGASASITNSINTEIYRIIHEAAEGKDIILAVQDSDEGKLNIVHIPGRFVEGDFGLIEMLVKKTQREFLASGTVYVPIIRLRIGIRSSPQPAVYVEDIAAAFAAKPAEASSPMEKVQQKITDAINKLEILGGGFSNVSDSLRALERDIARNRESGEGMAMIDLIVSFDGLSRTIKDKELSNDSQEQIKQLIAPVLEDIQNIWFDKSGYNIKEIFSFINDALQYKSADGDTQNILEYLKEVKHSLEGNGEAFLTFRQLSSIRNKVISVRNLYEQVMVHKSPIEEDMKTLIRDGLPSIVLNIEYAKTIAGPATSQAPYNPKGISTGQVSGDGTSSSPVEIEGLVRWLDEWVDPTGKTNIAIKINVRPESPLNNFQWARILGLNPTFYPGGEKRLRDVTKIILLQKDAIIEGKNFPAGSLKVYRKESPDRFLIIPLNGNGPEQEFASSPMENEDQALVPVAEKIVSLLAPPTVNLPLILTKAVSFDDVMERKFGQDLPDEQFQAKWPAHKSFSRMRGPDRHDISDWPHILVNGHKISFDTAYTFKAFNPRGTEGVDWHRLISTDLKTPFSLDGILKNVFPDEKMLKELMLREIAFNPINHNIAFLLTYRGTSRGEQPFEQYFIVELNPFNNLVKKITTQGRGKDAYQDEGQVNSALGFDIDSKGNYYVLMQRYANYAEIQVFNQKGDMISPNTKYPRNSDEELDPRFNGIAIENDVVVLKRDTDWDGYKNPKERVLRYMKIKHEEQESASSQASGNEGASSPVEKVIYSPEDFLMQYGGLRGGSRPFFIDLKQADSKGRERIMINIRSVLGGSMDVAKITWVEDSDLKEMPLNQITQFVKAAWDSLDGLYQVVAGNYVSEDAGLIVHTTRREREPVNGRLSQISGDKTTLLLTVGEAEISIPDDQIEAIGLASSPAEAELSRFKEQYERVSDLIRETPGTFQDFDDARILNMMLQGVDIEDQVDFANALENFKVKYNFYREHLEYNLYKIRTEYLQQTAIPSFRSNIKVFDHLLNKYKAKEDFAKRLTLLREQLNILLRDAYSLHEAIFRSPGGDKFETAVSEKYSLRFWYSQEINPKGEIGYNNLNLLSAEEVEEEVRREHTDVYLREPLPGNMGVSQTLYAILEKVEEALDRMDPNINDLRPEDTVAIIKEEVQRAVDSLKAGSASSPMMAVISDQSSVVSKSGDEIQATNNAPGGIDFNPALLDLQIKRDGNGVPLPLPQQPIETMRIDGFVPIIINITPIPNLPMLLGLADPAPDTQEIRPALKAREVEPVSLLN